MKPSRQRGWLRLLPVLVLTAGLIAPAAAEHARADSAVTISFLEKWPEPQYAPYFQKVVSDYQHLHPNVTINLQAVGDQPYKDKIRVLTAAGALPDIYFSWAGDFAKKFVRGGLAADLTKAFYGSTWHKTIGSGPVQAFTYSGKVYGIPIDLDAKFFVYNTAIFKQNGLTPPQTLANLLAACATLKSKGVQPIAFGNQYGWPAIHYLTTLNAKYVPPAVLQRDYTPETGKFTNPGYVQALTTLKQINAECLTPHANGISHEAAQAQFLAGRAAMQYVELVEFPIFTTSQHAPASIANNWSFFKFPNIPGASGDPGALTGAPDGFMVSPKTQHMAVVIDFLKFFTSPTNARLMTKMMGYPSPVVGSATAQNAFPQLIQAIDQVNHASSMSIWLDTVTQASVAQAYLAGAEGLFDGNRTPQQVIASVQKAASAAAKAVHG